MLGTDRAGTRPERRLLKQRDRPAAGLEGVDVALLCLGLQNGLMRPILQDRVLIAGVDVCHDTSPGHSSS